MSEDFVAQVRIAIAAIPHEALCSTEAGFCACDRDERIAQAVARAIEAAVGPTAHATYELRGAALRALRGTS